MGVAATHAAEEPTFHFLVSKSEVYTSFAPYSPQQTLSGIESRVLEGVKHRGRDRNLLNQGQITHACTVTTQATSVVVHTIESIHILAGADLGGGGGGGGA